MSRPPKRLTFGQCARCPYRDTGSVATCFTCARGTIPRVEHSTSCLICDIELGASGRCGSPLCSRSDDERAWTAVWAISRRRGALRDAITAYKYDGKWGWAAIFARILVGYLEARADAMRDFDLIIPSPTFVGEGGRAWDHTGRIIEEAQALGPSWPFRLDVMAKAVPTPRLATAGSFSARAHIAETQIGRALTVLEPDAVAGRAVLVFDDVFTGGLTLREVARKLRAAGASDVYGIALARQPFGG